MEILIRTRQELIDFLKARSIEDSEIKWVCPKCGTTNNGAYHSHETRCGECGKFSFPRLSLKKTLNDEKEASEIAKEVCQYKRKIERQYEVIGDLEEELYEEKRRLDELKEELASLKSCDMEKVVPGWS